MISKEAIEEARWFTEQAEERASRGKLLEGAERIARLEELVLEIFMLTPAFDDFRLRYVEVQVDKTWLDEAGALLGRKPTYEGFEDDV